MAVNLHLTDWHPATPNDAWRRQHVGWNAELTDEEVWDLNRGYWAIGAAADEERYATMSYRGTIRIVAELTGPREPVKHLGRKFYALVGHVLPPGNPVREALIDRPVVGRHVSYPDTSDVGGTASPASRDAFLLTHNPEVWDWEGADFAEALAATRDGNIYSASWSIDGRTGGVEEGDRAFLIRLGRHGRGLVGSGTITGPIYIDEHYDDAKRPGRFVPVDWDVVLEPSHSVDIAQLEAALPEQHWHPQGSGIRIRPAVLDGLEVLWAEHLAALDHGQSAVARSGGGRGQGWQADPAVRKVIEDAAQDRLEQHFRTRGWEIKDVRYEKRGFDALAIKDGKELYLEAKGTMASGWSVIVSRGEVKFSRKHPGQCRMGIWSGIRLTAEGRADPASGDFRVIDWSPDRGVLDPREFDWTPRPSDL